MSKDLLKKALQNPTKVAFPILKTLLGATGAGLGSGGALKGLDLLNKTLHSPMSEAAYWGVIGSGGIIGHDLAKSLLRKQKVAACKKKRIEKPVKKEYKLAHAKTAMKMPLSYLPALALPAAAGVGAGHWMGKTLLPHSRKLIQDGDLLAGGATLALPMLGASNAAYNMAEFLRRRVLPKSARDYEKYLAQKHGAKTAALSRAAKGAIALPAAALALGPVAAATHMPGIADDMIAQLTAAGKGKLDDIPGLLRGLYGPLRVPHSMGLTGKDVLGGDIMATAGKSLAGLSALGAGAGKLSERVIPVAKKSFLEDPKKRKMLLAASLFPWLGTAAGVGYLANKAMNSDS